MADRVKMIKLLTWVTVSSKSRVESVSGCITVFYLHCEINFPRSMCMGDTGNHFFFRMLASVSSS
jgi:hypothetical protein